MTKNILVKLSAGGALITTLGCGVHGAYEEASRISTKPKNTTIDSLASIAGYSWLGLVKGMGIVMYSPFILIGVAGQGVNSMMQTKNQIKEDCEYESYS
jgi:hypothetical protein